MASSGDKKLAHSAHMFHFQHQKQQVIALERYVIYDGRNPNHKCLLTYSPPIIVVIPDAIDEAPILEAKATKITRKETTLFTSALD